MLIASMAKGGKAECHQGSSQHDVRVLSVTAIKSPRGRPGHGNADESKPGDRNDKHHGDCDCGCVSSLANIQIERRGCEKQGGGRIAAAVTNASRKWRMIGAGFGSLPPVWAESALRIEFQPMKTSIAP